VTSSPVRPRPPFRPRLGPWLAVLGVAAVAPALWLALTIPREGFALPSDDAWIHQVFARNLARDGILAYNAGEKSAGVTAPLWTFLVSEAYFFHLPPLAVAVGLSYAGYVLWLMALYWLMRGVWPEASPWWAAAAAMLAAPLGPLVWYALSGLETTLFFALATLAAAAFGRRRPVLAGFCAAAGVPLRPEGIILVALLAAWWGVTLVRERRRPTAAELVGYVAFPALFILPFAVHNLVIGGSIFPTTYYGRRWLFTSARTLGHLVNAQGPLFFMYYWAKYLAVYVLGLTDYAVFAKIAADPFVLALIGSWAAVVALVRRRLPAGLAFFMVWLLLHNAAYAFFLTNLGTAARYQGANFAFFAVAVVYGCRLLWVYVKAPGFRVVPFILLGGTAVATVASYEAWERLYADNIHHLTTVHEAAGRWVDKNLPRDARVAAFDIGAFGYYANRYIVDTGGLLDPAAFRYQRRKYIIPYIAAKGAHYIQVMELPDPEAVPLSERLGIFTGSRTAYDITLVKSWELEPSRREGLAITAVAYPVLKLYKIRYYGE